MALSAAANQPNSVRKVQTESFDPKRITPARGSGTRGVRKVQSFASNNPRYQTTDQEFRQGYAEAGLQPQGLKKPTSNTRVTNIQPNETPRERVYRPQVIKKRRSGASKVKNKAVVTGINSAIFSVGIPFWSMVQIPFALLNVAFFGMSALFHSFASGASAASSSEESSWVWRGVVFVADKIISGINVVLNNLFGFNLSDLFGFLDPTPLFLLTNSILLAVGVIILFLMYLAYKLAGLNPLSGRAGGLKLGMLMLAFAGYATPLLNMLPWFMVWAVVVWKYPK